MANDQKVKENDINNSKRRGFGSKGSTTTSGSATTDSLGLRRSTRETPTKKQSLSSTSNTRKSERLVTRSPVTTPVKRNSEPAEKQRMPSPLKKNERSEKQCSSSSSGSKTSEKCLSDARVWSRNEKQNPKPRMILIKKRLDARTYRALLNPQARISKGTADLGHRLKREDKQSQGDNYYHIGASGSKEVEEDGDECSEGEDKQSQGESYHIEASASKEVEEDGNECSEGENKQSQGESCHIGASGSKETEEDGDECSERRKEKAVGELSHFNCKQKNHHEENHDFESQDKLPVLETGGISGQSSPDRAVQKETKDDSNGMQVECSVGEDFQRPELMKSASKGRSLAGETGTGGADKAGILIRKRDTIDLDSDTSSTEASKEICSTTADAVSSSPSGSKMGNFIERCVVCSKRQRVDFDSREGDFCTCNVKYGFTEKSAKRKNQYRGISKRPWGKWVAETSRKGVRVRIGTFKTAEEAARAYDAESRRIRGKKAHLNFPEEMPSAAQKRTVKSNPRKPLPKANMTPEKQNLDQNLSLDRREPEAGDGTGVTEECLSDGQHDKTPLIFRTEADQNASVFNKLDSGGEGASPDALKVDSSYNNAKLECLAQFSPFEHKSESSKFVEYWVPVKLSSVQLEHYCGALFSNEPSLRSSSKNDSVGALRDMLISARKCCDHPYLLEPSLQSLLTKGLPVVEYLDVGIKASGKLQLLDKILQEMKRCGLRALILFQSFGLPTLGDILDDFLRQRFGPDSYERVDVGLSSRKKQAAMNMFNSRERGEFVFLLENRACHPSMKLLSVDAIILFDSDWNPLNDLRGLQRIHIDSQLKQIKVFRLYTPCTIEEQILNLAKQDMFLDGNLQNINHSYCHMLLIWGASYLFSKLDEFHGGNTSVSGLNILSNEPFMNAVVEELLIHLPQNAENTNKSNCSLTSKVKQSGASYSKDIPLLGESKVQLRDEEPPHVFWTKLLQGRYPRWRYYLSGSSQRIRKRVQYFDEPPRKSDVECDEVIKKRKKVADNTTDPISLKPWLEDKRKVLTGGKEGTSGTQASNGSQSLPRSAVNMGEINHVSSPTNEISGVSEGHLVESGERRKLNDAQKSLYLLLKPEISILCEILKLPGYIKGMAGRFLDYTMKNHHVNREPVAILHAFQISVCWTAASLLKYKINRKESLAHAKQILNFECNEEEADFIYSKLRILKKMFYRRIETSTELEPPEDSSPRVKDVSKMFPRASSSSSQSMEEELEEGEIRESSESHNFPPHVPAKQGHVTDSDKTSWSQKNDFSKGISQFDKICAKRMKKLLQKQQEEVQKFNEIGEKKRAKLEKELTLELALVRTLHRHTSTKLDKKKRAEQDHMKKVEEHNRRWEVLKKKLEDSQLLARNKENWRKAYWLEQARRGLSVERFAKLPLPDSWFVAGELVANHISGLSSEKSDPNMTFPIKPGEILPSKVTRTIPNETAEGSGMDVTLDMQPNREEDRTDATIALQSDGVGNRLDGLSLEKSDPNITFSIKPGEILPSKVTKTIPNETAEGSGMDVTLNLQPNREEDRTDATIALQSDGVVNRLDTMLDLQSNREDDEMDASLAVQSNENSNRMDTMLDLQPNREDDGMDAANVSMQSNGDSNRLDTTLDMQHNREDDRVDATSLDMQSNGEACGLDGTIAMHSVRDDNEVDNTVSMQPHRGNNRMDTTRGMQSCREDNAMDATALERETLARDDQHNRADSSNSVDLHSRDSSLPLDEILRVEHCEPPTSAAVQDEAVSSEMQNTPEQLQVLLLQPADVLPSDESNHDTSVTEPVQQLQLLVSMDPPCTACDQQDVPLVMGTYHETTCEGRSSFQQAQVQEHPLMGNLADPCSPSASTPPVEDCSEPPQSLPQPITPLLLHLPVERPSVGSVTLVSDTSMATIPESSNSPETVCSGGSSTHVPVTGGMGTVPESSNHPLQPTAFATQMCQPWFHDPLYVEMERLNKEKEQTIKLHGGLKLRLESERDKEIEEIHRKYAALLEEAETALLQKRKALDSNYNKVYMNKLLADAFRSKFNEQRETGAQGQRQGISTSFMQQLFQQSLQQHAQRPAPVSAPPAAPPLQIVHQSSALFSSNPVRQQISPVVPAAANFQVDSELRAPAPHLKHLRCSTSMLAPNIQPVPHNIPSQQALGNAASTSSMIPQLAPRAPTHSSGPFSRSQQLENAVGLAAGFSNSSLSALELLMDAGNHPGANQPSLLQPLPDLGPTLGSWGTAARPDPTADFVCISDDD